MTEDSGARGTLSDRLLQRLYVYIHCVIKAGVDLFSRSLLRDIFSLGDTNLAYTRTELYLTETGRSH